MEKEAVELYRKFILVEKVRLLMLQRYYEGKHKILDKADRTTGKPDTKAVHNYARYITVTSKGYFMGKPVSYKVVDEANKDKFEPLRTYIGTDGEHVINSQHAENCSIFGRSYELMYINENKELKFKDMSPLNVVIKRDGTIENKILFAVIEISRQLIKDKTKVTLNVYDAVNVMVISFLEGEEETTIESTTPHYIEGVPVLEYGNNSRNMGDFEFGIVSLIDAYNDAQSTSIDDMKDFNDAYLMLKNMSGTGKDTIEDMKKQKVLLVDDDGDAKFITKDTNSSFTDSNKNRLNQDIHKFSMVPDLSDENFSGNLSGVAIKFKMFPLEQLRSDKEVYFKMSLSERIDKIIAYLKPINDLGITANDIDKVFTANLPANLSEVAQVITSLSGIVSQETLLSQLPFIKNPADEMEKIDAEMQNEIDSVNYYPTEEPATN